MDDRFYITFYGVYTNDWDISWGGQNFNHLLVKEYLSDAASTTSDSAWQSDGIRFIYPHNIKKKYFIEGIVEGQITFYAKSETSYVTDFRVDIYKLHEDTTETLLATTGTSTPSVGSRTLNYSGGVGDEIVFPFWIDVFDEPKEIGEYERLMVKVSWNSASVSGASAYLMHDNDSQYEDLKITIPFILGD